MNTKRHIPQIGSIDEYSLLHGNFRWKVPKQFTIALACAPQNNAEAGLAAIIIDSSSGDIEILSFGELWRDSRKLANT
jgi:hypothetical protein